MRIFIFKLIGGNDEIVIKARDTNDAWIELAKEGLDVDDYTIMGAQG